MTSHQNTFPCCKETHDRQQHRTSAHCCTSGFCEAFADVHEQSADPDDSQSVLYCQRFANFSTRFRNLCSIHSYRLKPIKKPKIKEIRMARMHAMKESFIVGSKIREYVNIQTMKKMTPSATYLPKCFPMPTSASPFFSCCNLSQYRSQYTRSSYDFLSLHGLHVWIQHLVVPV